MVREVPKDPGPHERLMTVREVAARLGVCKALVYKLCQRNELLALRIGGTGELTGAHRMPARASLSCRTLI